MTLWELALVYEAAGGIRERVWKLWAYLGRYAHQPLQDLRRCTVRELSQLAGDVSDLVAIENGPNTARVVE